MELLDDPAGKPGGRVAEAIAQRLRVLALDLLIRAAFGNERTGAGHVGLLDLSERRIAGNAEHHVDVQTRHVLWVDHAKLRRNH
ncbi:unannotated protein [freshwater metagenome]|uniref:Unannotated protein n=1 Tax=freshwater metagenome TaxID=449393 RepID=A0A6J6P6D1_9ZZZZ